MIRNGGGGGVRTIHCPAGVRSAIWQSSPSERQSGDQREEGIGVNDQCDKSLIARSVRVLYPLPPNGDRLFSSPSTNCTPPRFRGKHMGHTESESAGLSRWPR